MGICGTRTFPAHNALGLEEYWGACSKEAWQRPWGQKSQGHIRLDSQAPEKIPAAQSCLLLSDVPPQPSEGSEKQRRLELEDSLDFRILTLWTHHLKRTLKRPNNIFLACIMLKLKHPVFSHSNVPGIEILHQPRSTAKPTGSIPFYRQENRGPQRELPKITAHASSKPQPSPTREINQFSASRRVFLFYAELYFTGRFPCKRSYFLFPA